MRVHIADGDQAFPDVAKEYLSRHGHEVKIATNGLESVALMQCDAPDVVVLQRELLWGGGDGVLALMQQLSGWSKIPVIPTSDGGMPDEPGPIASRQLVAQLEKPHQLEELLEACSRACASNRA